MRGFWDGKRVAVLGGAGMIGSFLTALLVEAGAEVTVADNLSRGRMSNLDGVECHFEYADLTRVHNCRAIKGKDAVFNLAARVTGMHYNRLHHGEMFYHNLMLQIIPLQASIMWKVPLFLQSSTVCVYPRDMTFPVSEEEGHRGEPEPTNLGYGLAKRMGERYAQWVYQETGMGIGITRFSNCFGPRDYFDPKTSHVIPALIKRTLKARSTVKVYGTGNQIREFLYAEDAAIGAMKVLEHHATADPVNIGNPNNRITIRKLAYLIQNVLFGYEQFKPLHFDLSIEDGYPRRGSDISKLIEVTGWQPETSLVEGLQETINWYRENKELAERSEF